MKVDTLLRHRDRIISIINDFPEDDQCIYFVVANTEMKIYAKQKIIEERGSRFANSVRIVDLFSLHLLRGVDPFMIFIDEDIFNVCSSKQMTQLYTIMDARDKILQGEYNENSDCGI